MVLFDQDTLKDHLKKCPPSPENGGLWFKWMLVEFPKLKLYFIGDTNIASDDIASSARFQKSGGRFIRKIHTLVQVGDNPREFSKHVYDIVDRHKKRYHFDQIDMFSKVGRAWTDFMHFRAGSTPEQLEEWNKFWTHFQRESERAETGVRNRSLTDWHAPRN